LLAMGIWRRRAARLGMALVAVPAVGGLAGYTYIQYRIATRPTTVEFKPLVDANGRITFRDKTLEPPSRFSIFFRVLHLLWIFVPIYMLYLVIPHHRPDWQRWWLEILLRGVERAGPAFVKAGQWTCTRNDLFTPMFREVFGSLYSEVSIHPYEDSKRIIEEELGQPIEEVFTSLKESPIGSGSIGQVHEGILKADGRRVVVKVMHPNVVETIARDFFIINDIARIIDKYFRSLDHLNVKNTALTWTNHLAGQLDFRIEEEHLNLFHKFAIGETKFVEFPVPIRATQRVLIETYAAGEPATPQYLGSLPTHTRDILAGIGLNCYCKMLLRDNFIHGDMHPGNILVDARDEDNPVVTMIDVGLCQKLSELENTLSHDLMGSFVRWDPDLCGRTLYAMGDQKFTDKEAFTRDINNMFKHYRPITGDEEGVVDNILQSVFEVVRRHRVIMDPGFSSLMFSIIVLEGFIMSLNPEFNMVRHASGWLISEGHISKKLVKNIFYSAEDALRTKWKSMKSKLRGDTDEYVSKRRPRWDQVGGRYALDERPAEHPTPQHRMRDGVTVAA